MHEEPSSIDFARISVGEILDALADGAYVTDTERRIVFWNRAAGRITGWSRSDVVGHSCRDNLLVHVDKDGHALCGQEHCPLHRAIVTGETSVEPMLVFAQHLNGHRVPVEVSVAPIRNGEGDVIGGVEVFRDLTSVMDDLSRARVIQEHVLPESLPVVEGLEFGVRYTPQELVGGDFYRVEPVGDGRYAVLVADVMGHGVAAGLYTMQLRVLWDDARQLLRDPARFMAELNRRLSRLVSRDGAFATGVLVVVDPKNGDWECVRAGHPAPVVLKQRGSEAQLVGKSSPALGLNAGAEYASTSGRLDKGDLMLLYTDGAEEVINPEGEVLTAVGLGRLARETLGVLGGSQLEDLERALLAYSGRIRLEDDLTLLTIRKTCGHEV